LKVHGFPKSEHLVSRKQTEELFTSGQSHSLTAFPLRAVWKLSDVPAPSPLLPVSSPLDSRPSLPQVLVSVSKRHFKHAVDRNRVKRQLREAYRLNKQVLVGRVPEGQTLSLAFVWMSDSILPTADVFSRMKNLLGRIAAKL